MSISLGRYLFERIHQQPVGVGSVFGVPGDFNLTLLDKIDEVDGLSWKGNANELNAAYAADGYSRVKSGFTDGPGGFAALVTTFGVGELSALNGIAGAYAEHVGLLHIVGVPSISAQQKQLLLHHTLGNGDFTVFQKMSAQITQTSGFVKDGETGPDVIDRCIREAFINQRPTYLAFPANLVDEQVPLERLKQPLDLKVPPNDKESEEEVLERVLELISKAKDPIILIDACCARHDATKEAKELIDRTEFKYAITPMAKGARDISEDHPRFTGVYVGTLSYPDVKEAVESSDLVISLGAMLSDFNTGSFSYSYQTKNVIEFHSDYTKIRQAQYPGIRMKNVLRSLLDDPKFEDSFKHYQPSAVVKNPYKAEEPKNEIITQQWLWSKLSSWLREGDVIVTETGTSSFGIIQTKYPKNAIGISQVLWGSIGYSVGAAFGGVVAAEELDPNRRVILFVGDGSLQLTIQEISSMVRNKNNIYVFVLNNDGYTIERLIHGETAEYNDIQSWKHGQILDTFGAKEGEFESLKVSTPKELNNLFSDKQFAKNDKTRLIEIMLEKMDAPDNLVKQAQLSAKANSG
ncbi:pyruvate decarboxylase [Suhomyces tanzawaensis NRRL Y-17324]|uniref:Pyruvate decarboxylase n=1 Tax=Suhomyces tanzawaensis NRRL Y-17324 TaxID=984487 RepID=A0A1E4SGC4_9ASCO|nr:pyruvate decarboxylase [Suhomyces tanzawaensis NRRL Y-17324]ODV78515.1 pyruvate decarboxylase [Suhomyces tanzawaensis NRRL Y-17324]